MNNHIELHSKDSFLKMHDAGKLAAEVQQDRVSEDIWQEKLSIKLEDYTEISIAEAAERIGLDTANINRADQNRITASLKGLGFEREGRFTQGPYRNSVRYTRKS